MAKSTPDSHVQAEDAARPSGTAATQSVFGASADEIWYTECYACVATAHYCAFGYCLLLTCRNEEVAEHLGMSTGKAKKRKTKRRSVTAAAVCSCRIVHILGPAYVQTKQGKRQQDKTNPGGSQPQIG